MFCIPCVVRAVRCLLHDGLVLLVGCCLLFIVDVCCSVIVDLLFNWCCLFVVDCGCLW